MKEPKLSVFEILRKRYPANEYCLMAEVRDKAGFSASRSADFIAINLWPSRGLSINGIELKSFRNDWLSELKKPEKAENIFQYCDYFWLLTSDEHIAKIEEIPEAWGWLIVKGEKTFVQKEAPKLNPKPVSRHFLCALLKRADDKSNFVHIDSIEDKIEQAKENGRHDAQWQIKTAQDKLKELNESIIEFEKASGITLDFRGWAHTPKQTGEAVKIVMTHGPDKIRQDLLNLQSIAKKINERLETALRSLPKVIDTAQLEIPIQE